MWAAGELESRGLQRNTNNVPVGRRDYLLAAARTSGDDPPRYQDVRLDWQPSGFRKATPGSLCINTRQARVAAGPGSLQRATGGGALAIRFGPERPQMHRLSSLMRNEHEPVMTPGIAPLSYSSRYMFVLGHIAARRKQASTSPVGTLKV